MVLGIGAHDTVASVGFCAEEGVIRSLKQRIPIVGVNAAGRANTDCQCQRMVSNGESLFFNCLSQPFGDNQRIGMGCIAQDCDELFPAITKYLISLTQGASHCVGSKLQHAVAAVMARLIIDSLKKIYIDN